MHTRTHYACVLAVTTRRPRRTVILLCPVYRGRSRNAHDARCRQRSEDPTYFAEITEELAADMGVPRDELERMYEQWKEWKLKKEAKDAEFRDLEAARRASAAADRKAREDQAQKNRGADKAWRDWLDAQQFPPPSAAVPVWAGPTTAAFGSDRKRARR